MNVPEYQQPDVECSAEIVFPPARCTRPAGHRGEHMTAEIPAQLAPVAAKMVTASDRLDAEREELHAAYAQRFQRVRIAFVVLVASIGGVVIIGVAAVVGIALR